MEPIPRARIPSQPRKVTKFLSNVIIPSELRRSSDNVEKCLVVKGKGSNLIGDTIHVHKEFLPTLKKIDAVAKQCMIKLAVKGSYEQIPDPTKAVKFTTANTGRHIKFIVMDKTGKKLICNNVCLASESRS